mmetsp:Transcript_66851/g.188229  ORF Transcript_66851/g.188229 Transcript_66851/m.188229 type:complete len:312 (-) Transcript_66851:330-1265(-)
MLRQASLTEPHVLAVDGGAGGRREARDARNDLLPVEGQRRGDEARALVRVGDLPGALVRVGDLPGAGAGRHGHGAHRHLLCRAEGRGCHRAPRVEHEGEGPLPGPLHRRPPQGRRRGVRTQGHRAQLHLPRRGPSAAVCGGRRLGGHEGRVLRAGLRGRGVHGGACSLLDRPAVGPDVRLAARLLPGVGGRRVRLRVRGELHRGGPGHAVLVDLEVVGAAERGDVQVLLLLAEAVRRGAAASQRLPQALQDLGLPRADALRHLLEAGAHLLHLLVLLGAALDQPLHLALEPRDDVPHVLHELRVRKDICSG